MNNKIENNKTLNNIFIFDWDDTLYPTSFHKNKIIDINQYELYFLELDKSISSLFQKLIIYGKIVIVSNATMSWINTCLTKLPHTSKFKIDNNINIFSTRDIFNKTNIQYVDWKKIVFKNIIDNIILTHDKNNYLNIISFGDADFEYYALINLHEYLSNINHINCYLKNIRFIANPTCKQVVEQIDLVHYNILNIIDKKHYVDMNILPM